MFHMQYAGIIYSIVTCTLLVESNIAIGYLIYLVFRIHVSYGFDNFNKKRLLALWTKKI